jgi:hypothetical protein
VRHAASAWAAAAVISSDLAQLPPRVLTGARGGGIGGIGSMSEGERGPGGGGGGDETNFNAPNAAVSAVVGATESDGGAVVSAATASAVYVLDPKRPP